MDYHWKQIFLMCKIRTGAKSYRDDNMDKTIKLLVMDVDGTLTDGKIYMGASGESFKAFDVKDGYGICELLPQNGIKAAILTGRESSIVLQRAKELGISYVMQNVKDKKAALIRLSEMAECAFQEMAYIGDDLIDLEAMKLCGLKGAPADAISIIKENADYVTKGKAGNGSVREFIEWIVEKSK